MNGFDILAPVYDKLTNFIFGDKVYNASVRPFGYIKPGDKVLIIGGGTGKLLKEIPHNANVTYVELSPKMICRAAKVETGAKVKFINDSWQYIPDENYDVVITPFFLDLFNTETAIKLIDYVSNKMVPEGIWLYSDFAESDIRKNKILLFIMYGFFRLLCRIEAKQLPNYNIIFSKHFKKLEEEYFFNGFIISAVFQRFRS